ncbi:MAG: hypothetical protein ACJ8GV_13180 [Luteimonas sp.]
MTLFEALTLLIALLAVVVSAVALNRAGLATAVAEEANNLARAQDALAKLHLERENARSNKAVLSLDLVKVENRNKFGHTTAPSYKFELKNESTVPATACRFEILTPGSPLMAQNYSAKLPATLAPGQTLRVLAAVA